MKKGKKEINDNNKKSLSSKKFSKKNNTTDATKNIASQTPGLNQAKTIRDDQFPSDGDDSDV